MTDHLPNNADPTPTEKSVQPFSPNRLAQAVSSCLPESSRPLKKPTVDKNLTNLPTTQRVTEALTYNLLCFEYALSPKGGLRQWLKLNLVVWILLGIPAVLFLPLLMYVMFGFETVFGILASATHLLLVSAENVLKLIVVVVIICALLYAIVRFVSRPLTDRKQAPDRNRNIVIEMPPNTKTKGELL